MALERSVTPSERLSLFTYTIALPMVRFKQVYNLLQTFFNVGTLFATCAFLLNKQNHIIGLIYSNWIYYRNKRLQ